MERTDLIRIFVEQVFEDYSDSDMVVGVNSDQRGRWYAVCYYRLDSNWNGGAITNRRYERIGNAKRFLLAHLGKT
jgi:hypothetical protein